MAAVYIHYGVRFEIGGHEQLLALHEHEDSVMPRSDDVLVRRLAIWAEESDLIGGLEVYAEAYSPEDGDEMTVRYVVP